MLLNQAQVKHSAVLQRDKESLWNTEDAESIAETRAVPWMAVDGGTVEKGRREVLPRAEAAEHQTDPVERRQHKHDEGHDEAAVVRLPDTAVNPAEPRHTQQPDHKDQQPNVCKWRSYTWVR